VEAQTSSTNPEDVPLQMLQKSMPPSITNRSSDRDQCIDLALPTIDVTMAQDNTTALLGWGVPLQHAAIDKEDARRFTSRLHHLATSPKIMHP
jgi:hypothetical protein